LTVLNFTTSAKNAYIVTDSSFSHPDDMMPAGYCTKAYTLPHLEGIIAGTGVMDFIAEWFIRANTGFLIRDLVHMDEYATASLQELFEPHRLRMGASAVSTIYHFAYDRNERRVRTYVYRSTKNFVSEELPYGSALKPYVDMGDHAINVFPDDYLPVIEAQKAADLRKPLAERVGVGGHMVAYSLRAHPKEGDEEHVEITSHRSAALSEYEAGYQLAMRRL
jgi:hypothetical protein